MKNRINSHALLSAIYTLTPTHCGTGQTTGAIDLPIAREMHTGFPILPASSLKGVARDVLSNGPSSKEEGNRDKEARIIEQIFGSDLTGPETAGDDKDNQKSTKPAGIIIGEGRLICLPARSLNRAFVHVTCPLILERMDRDLRALGLDSFFVHGQIPRPKADQVHVSDRLLEGKPLVIEDLVYQEQQVGHLPQLEAFAKNLADLLPTDEGDTRNRLISNLVVIPDEDMCALAERATPVQARIKLTSGKTTGPFQTEEGEEKGNLWYEETLPPDCLFVCIITAKQPKFGFSSPASTEGVDGPFQMFRERSGKLKFVQLGGDASIGNGWCWWTIPNEESNTSNNR